MNPSVERMISMLPEKYLEVVTRERVIELEEVILKKLDFNLNFVSPLTFLERYLRLLDI